jgi:hypothetical protein
MGGAPDPVITSAIGNGRMPQRERGRGHNDGRWCGIALPCQDIQDDVS